MSPLEVVDLGETLAFSFDDLLRYAGPHSPGGVAQAFKVMERAFPLLAPDGRPARREIRIETAFGGPGARDGFELVTRAVTDRRYLIEPALARPELGRARARFVFRVEIGREGVTLVLREGFVTDAFVDLAGKGTRTPEEEAHLARLKAELAERTMAAPAAEVYALADGH
jgi:hypothetical protein